MVRYRYDGRTELRKAAMKRLADAEALLESDLRETLNQSSHARGAGYLGGYAIECKLKAVAMEAYGCDSLQALAEKWKVEEKAVYHHGLEVFAKRIHQLFDRLRQSPVWHDFASQVNRWRPDWRYDGRDWSHDKAKTFMGAVRRVYHWLDSNRC